MLLELLLSNPKHTRNFRLGHESIITDRQENKKDEKLKCDSFASLVAAYKSNTAKNVFILFYY